MKLAKRLAKLFITLNIICALFGGFKYNANIDSIPAFDSSGSNVMCIIPEENEVDADNEAVTAFQQDSKHIKIIQSNNRITWQPIRQ